MLLLKANFLGKQQDPPKKTQFQNFLHFGIELFSAKFIAKKIFYSCCHNLFSQLLLST